MFLCNRWNSQTLIRCLSAKGTLNSSFFWLLWFSWEKSKGNLGKTKHGSCEKSVGGHLDFRRKNLAENVNSQKLWVFQSDNSLQLFKPSSFSLMKVFLTIYFSHTVYLKFMSMLSAMNIWGAPTTTSPWRQLVD